MSASDVAFIMPRDVELGLEVERLNRVINELKEQLVNERNRTTPSEVIVELDDVISERKELNRQIDYLQDALDYSEQENRDLRKVLSENDIDY